MQPFMSQLTGICLQYEFVVMNTELRFFSILPMIGKTDCKTNSVKGEVMFLSILSIDWQNWLQIYLCSKWSRISLNFAHICISKTDGKITFVGYEVRFHPTLPMDWPNWLQNYLCMRRSKVSLNFTHRLAKLIAKVPLWEVK